jgi:hypothetical protein
MAGTRHADAGTEQQLVARRAARHPHVGPGPADQHLNVHAAPRRISIAEKFASGAK